MLNEGSGGPFALPANLCLFSLLFVPFLPSLYLFLPYNSVIIAPHVLQTVIGKGYHCLLSACLLNLNSKKAPYYILDFKPSSSLSYNDSLCGVAV